MKTLLIIFIVIWNGQIGFLSNDFTHGKIVCRNENDTYYIAVADYTYKGENPNKVASTTEPILKTYHTFPQPPIKYDWDCRASIWGDSYVYPSQYDIYNIDFKINSSLIKK